MVPTIAATPRREPGPNNHREVVPPRFAQRLRAPCADERALTAQDRRLAERRFGYDFSQVRIRDNSEAAELASDIGARGFTFGNRIFISSEHAPQPRSLLWHELSHVAERMHSEPNEARVQTATTVDRDALDVGGWWKTHVSTKYSALKESAYQGLINAVRSAHDAAFNSLRAKAGTLSEPVRRLANGLIEILDVVWGAVFAVVLAVIGIVVGFVEGVVDMVKGLIGLLYTLISLLIKFFYGFVDQGQLFDEQVNQILDSLKNLGPGLKALINDWLERFQHASSERQSLMIGELTGQVLAFIASFSLAATKAGQLPKLALEVDTAALAPRLAYAGEAGAAGSRLAIPINVAAPATAVVATGTTAAMISQAAPTGPRKSQYTSEEIQEHFREQTERPVEPDEATLKESGLSRRSLQAVYEKHHLLVRQYRRFFEKYGFDIDKYTIELSKDEHGWIHNEYHWNDIWRDFFKANPKANAAQIQSQLEQMMQQLGLKGLDLIDYRTGLKLGTQT